MMLVAAPAPEAAPGVRGRLNDHDLQLPCLCGARPVELWSRGSRVTPVIVPRTTNKPATWLVISFGLCAESLRRGQEAARDEPDD